MKTMKLILCLLIILLKISTTSAQQPEIPKGAIEINQSTLIKDTLGNILSLNDFIVMMNSGEWAADPKFNNEGELEFLQLRKATEEDKKMMSAMNSSPTENDRIGKSIPKFDLRDLEGKKFNSEKLIGKVIVINFWFTACKPCIMEMPELNELRSKYKNNSDVVFLSITYNSSKEIKQFLKKHDFEYPIVCSGQETVTAFEISGFPSNIVIDQNGKYSFFKTGGFPGIMDVLDGEIQKLLAK